MRGGYLILVQSRFQILHTAFFLTAMIGLLLGFVVSDGAVLLVSGLCFVASGAMTVLGHEITMHGPIGQFLRRAVGGLRLGGAYVIGGFWILLGVVLVIASTVMIVRGDRPLPEAVPAPPVETASTL